MAGVCIGADTRKRFRDRTDAAHSVTAMLRGRDLGDAIVVGLARGGVVTAAEVARELGAELDVVAVRKVGHPLQPEFAIGAVAPGGELYLRGEDELEPEKRAEIVDAARRASVRLDRRLRRGRRPVDLRGRVVLLVDDGLATGATMIAAVRWAHARGAARVIVAVPIAAASSLGLVAGDADEVVCARPTENLAAVGVWYERFEQVDDDEVVRLLDASARARAPLGD
jgi:predicted phosphoribosyltransferase